MEMIRQITLFDNENALEEVQEDREYVRLNDVYGKGIRIYPHIPSKQGPKYLQNLMPLEDYDHILVLFSGGKDSIGALLYLLDLGVPKSKIILLHHNIDGEGKNPVLDMDWPSTVSYCDKFAKALGIKIKYSWREGGFAGEILRFGASAPIHFEELESDVVVKTVGANWDDSERLKDQLEKAASDEEREALTEEIKKLGYRFKFPAKTASLSTRWCSSALKIEVCDRLLRYSQTTFKNKKVLVVDGIRREESPGRSRYNEMEAHATQAITKGRYVHHWRAVIEWNEADIWDIMKRYGVRPHLAYVAGFNRCSCAMCIFGQAHHFAGVKQLLPDRYNQLVQLEKDLGFTIDNKLDLESYVGNAKSCVPDNLNEDVLRMITEGEIPDDYILVKEGDTWELPSGAFHGAAGGPC